MVDFNVLTKTVFQLAGDVMVTLIVMIRQMKPVVVSFFSGKLNPSFNSCLLMVNHLFFAVKSIVKPS